MEDRFMAQCERNSQRLTDNEIDLSHKIKFRALEIIDGDGEYVAAYAAGAALVCIAKEAELMREWVIRRQYRSSDPDCILSNQIREHALSLMLHRGSGFVAATAGAAMVGAVKEAKLLCEDLRQRLYGGVDLCDEIREEACAVLLDLCKEASAVTASSGKCNIVAADDGAEKSVARYLGSTISKINAVGKKEKKDKDSKLGEKGKRAFAATDSHVGTPARNTPAITERRDLTPRADLDKERRLKDTIPPAPETTVVVTTETKIDMILTMVTGMAQDIAIIDERQKKMWHQQKRDIGRDKNIQSGVSVGAVLSPVGSEFGDTDVSTPLHKSSSRSSDDTDWTLISARHGLSPVSSSSTTKAPRSRREEDWFWVTKNETHGH